MEVSGYVFSMMIEYDGFNILVVEYNDIDLDELMMSGWDSDIVFCDVLRCYRRASSWFWLGFLDPILQAS